MVHHRLPPKRHPKSVKEPSTGDDYRHIQKVTGCVIAGSRHHKFWAVLKLSVLTCCRPPFCMAIFTIHTLIKRLS